LVVQFLDAVRKFVASRKRQGFRAVKLGKKDVALKDVACGGFEWKDMLTEKNGLLDKIRKQGRTDKYTGNGIVLFGPPGTGKTTIAKAVALELDWELVKLSPVDFLEKGESQVFATIKEKFRELKQLNCCVIFFDEMELLVLKRGDEVDWTTNLVTNVMLPELQELHDCSNVIPILATNYIDRIEKAGRRPGRFDFVLPVGFPTSDECKSFIDTVFRDHPIKNSYFVDELATIPTHATVSVLRAWLVRYINSPIAGFAAARELWHNEFSQLSATTAELRKFEDEVRDFAYPARAGRIVK
jgi:SpoVK/Ycf46/Vps4 family AAA+-type ATPase